MASSAKELVPVKEPKRRKDGRIDRRTYNNGVVGNKGGDGAKPWSPTMLRKEVEGRPGTFVEETIEQAWERTKQEVRHYVAIGYPQETIVRLIEPPLSEKTLVKYFQYELDNGRYIQDAKMAGTAYFLGVSGRDPPMTRFWIRARMGWRDNGPIPSGGMEVTFKLMPGDDW